MPEPIAALHVVGAGRAGLALGTALLEAGAVEQVTFGGRSAAPPAHPLFTGSAPRARYGARPEPPPDVAPDAVLIAVPDRAIASVAEELARPGALPVPTPVLHLSGAAGAELLDPLSRAGHPTGSLHPLVALPDPSAAERLRGGWFALEGAPAAVAIGRAFVSFLQGQVLDVAPGGKPLYHAAAVFASNHLVASLAVAERWMESAGVAPEQARAALAALAAGTLRNVARMGPVEALTGPVARGDVGTVRAHLGQLSAPDRRLYSVLAGEALALARRGGVDPAAADEIARLLEGVE